MRPDLRNIGNENTRVSYSNNSFITYKLLKARKNYLQNILNLSKQLVEGYEQFLKVKKYDKHGRDLTDVERETLLKEYKNELLKEIKNSIIDQEYLKKAQSLTKELTKEYMHFLHDEKHNENTNRPGVRQNEEFLLEGIKDRQQELYRQLQLSGVKNEYMKKIQALLEKFAGAYKKLLSRKKYDEKGGNLTDIKREEQLISYKELISEKKKEISDKFQLSEMNDEIIKKLEKEIAESKTAIDEKVESEIKDFINQERHPLVQACEERSIEEVKRLVEQRSKEDRASYINQAQEAEGQGPFHVLSCIENLTRDDKETKSIAIARYLMEQGGNVNEPNDSQYTPLHIACKFGSLGLVKLFIEGVLIKNYTLRADTEVKRPEVILLPNRREDYRGVTNQKIRPLIHPLIKACELRDIVLVKRLIEQQTKEERAQYINQAKNIDGGGPFHVLSDTNQLLGPQILKYDRIKLFNQSVEIARYLMEQGGDVNQPDRSGVYPLHIAETCHFKLTELLMKGIIIKNYQVRAGINEKSEFDRTPLHIAVWQKDYEMTVYLLDHGALIDERTNEEDGKQTALHIAVLKNDLRIVELLIQRGCNVNSIDKNKNTAYANAYVLTHNEIVDFLKRHYKTVDKISKFYAQIAIAINLGVHLKANKSEINFGMVESLTNMIVNPVFSTSTSGEEKDGSECKGFSISKGFSVFHRTSRWYNVARYNIFSSEGSKAKSKFNEIVDKKLSALEELKKKNEQYQQKKKGHQWSLK